MMSIIIYYKNTHYSPVTSNSIYNVNHNFLFLFDLDSYNDDRFNINGYNDDSQ